MSNIRGSNGPPQYYQYGKKPLLFTILSIELFEKIKFEFVLSYEHFLIKKKDYKKNNY